MMINLKIILNKLLQHRSIVNLTYYMCYDLFNFFLSFFQYCGFQNFGKFSHILDLKKKLHIKNEIVELVPILFKPHCEYSPFKNFKLRFLLKGLL